MTLQEYFDNHTRWIQGGIARNEHGHDVPIQDPHAVSFSLLGAVHRFYEVKTEQPDLEDAERTDPTLLKRRAVKARLAAAAESLYPAEAILATDADGTFYLDKFNDSPTVTFAMIRALVEKAGV